MGREILAASTEVKLFGEGQPVCPHICTEDIYFRRGMNITLGLGREPRWHRMGKGDR